MRVKVEYRTSSKEVYKRFCQAYPDIKLSFKDWKKIIYTFNELYRDYILESGARVKMPNGFGYFAITKKKLKRFKNFKDPEGNNYINLPIDWAKTKKAGKRIYHTNPHTDGWKGSWMWFRDDARFYLSDIWNFVASRKSSRLLGKFLKIPNSPYLQKYKNWKNNE